MTSTRIYSSISIVRKTADFAFHFRWINVEIVKYHKFVFANRWLLIAVFTLLGWPANVYLIIQLAPELLSIRNYLDFESNSKSKCYFAFFINTRNEEVFENYYLNIIEQKHYLILCERYLIEHISFYFVNCSFDFFHET